MVLYFMGVLCANSLTALTALTSIPPYWHREVVKPQPTSEVRAPVSCVFFQFRQRSLSFTLGLFCSWAPIDKLSLNIQPQLTRNI